MRKVGRNAVVASCALLLIASACNRGEEEPELTPSPFLESVGGFELVAHIMDIQLGGTAPDIPPDFPGPGIEGVKPPLHGSSNVEIVDLSSRLATECDLTNEDVTEVHWTTQTGFESPELPEFFLDEEEFSRAIEGETIGVVGAIFKQPETEAEEDEITGLVPTDPDAQECTLVAEQVFLVQEGEPLPSPRPRTGPRSTPAPSPPPAGTSPVTPTTP